MRTVVKKIIEEKIVCDICGVEGREEDADNPIIRLRILRTTKQGRRGRPAKAQYPTYDAHARCAEGAYIEFPGRARRRGLIAWADIVDAERVSNLHYVWRPATAPEEETQDGEKQDGAAGSQSSAPDH